MPGVSQTSVDEMLRDAEAAAKAGVGGIILFGVPETKDATGSSAWDDKGAVQSAVRALKKEIPDLVVITDVCMCEYTDHGHCGVLKDGDVDNDATLELLSRAALSHARAGADIVAPSDMMDGRVQAIQIRARRRRSFRCRDPQLRRQVRVGVLRSVPRGGRVDAADRRSPRLPDGSGQRRRRRCAKCSPTSRRARTR